MPASTSDTVIKTLVLTDLVDSTRLVETSGDQASAGLLARHDRLARDLLVRHHGQEVDKSDGFLLVFERPVDAVVYALGYHRALAALSDELSVPLTARVGIHLGEVILRPNPAEDIARGAKPVEVEGLAKPTAARVMGLAGGCQTLITRGAFDLARRAVVGDPELEGGIRWMAHGPYLLKGVEDTVDICEVGIEGFAPLAPPADSEKAKRAIRPGDEATLGWRAAQGQPVPFRPHWTLSEKIGEGGFGEVWMIAHRKTRARHLVKYCYEADRLRALKREVTIFRIMRESLGERDDIVKVLDWQFDQPPFFVECEYTEGKNLGLWADLQGGLVNVPLADRLDIVAQTATAIAAAHSVGVLHKDIKPSNILIRSDDSGRPRVRLIDFGIGEIVDRRALEAHGITATGLRPSTSRAAGEHPVAGTRIYMAPEVLEGKPATTLADIYTLGVVFYQLVIGDHRRALAPGWERDVTDDMLREDIAACVDGVPTHRLGSALELAERLRTLDERRGERAAARAEAERVRAAEEQARIEAALAEAAREQARVEGELRQQAESARNQAEQLMNFMLTDLKESLEAIGRLDLLDQVAERASEYVTALPEDGSPSSSALARITVAQNVGDVRLAQGRSQLAIEAYRSATAMAERLRARDPGEAQWTRARADSLSKLGRAQYEQRDLDGALASRGEALAIREGMTSLQPADPAAKSAMAWDLGAIGAVLWRKSSNPEAVTYYRRAVRLREELVEAAPESAAMRSELAQTLLFMSACCRAIGDAPAALELARRGKSLMEELAAANPDNARYQRGLSWACGALGEALGVNGLHAEAILAYEQSLQILRRRADNDPTNAQITADLTWAYSMLGQSQARVGRHAEGEAAMRESLAIHRRLVAGEGANGTTLASFAWGLLGLARSMAGRGAKADALDLFREAVGVLDQLQKSGRLPSSALENYADALVQLGLLEADLGDVAGAVATLEAADALVVQLPPASTHRREQLVKVGEALQQLGARGQSLPPPPAGTRK